MTRLGLVAALTRILPLVFVGAFYWVFIERTTFEYSGHRIYTLFDDAMISMRYARNLAEGNGLVWNPGETPVEGYTNPLWTLWMALLHAARIPEATISGVVSLSAGLLLFLAALVFRAIARQVYPDYPLAKTAAFWGTLVYYPLVFWSLRGLEVPLITLLLGVSVLICLRLQTDFSVGKLIALSTLASLGLLTRMDFLVPAAIVALFAIYFCPRRKVMAGTIILGGIAVSLSVMLAFRVTYYGDLLPNTYYLKVGGISQLARLERGVASFGYLYAVHLFAPLILVCCYLIQRRIKSGAEVCLLAVFAGLCLYSIEVGGDAWEDFGFTNRYIAPGVPFLFLLSAGAVRALAAGGSNAGSGILVWAAAALIATAGLQPSLSRGVPIIQAWVTTPAVADLRVITPLLMALALLLLWRNRAHPNGGHWFKSKHTPAIVMLLLMVSVNLAPAASWLKSNAPQATADGAWSSYGLLLRDTTAPNARIAVVSAGALSYFSHRDTVDQLGKVDPVIAKDKPARVAFQPGHSKWNLAHSIGLQRPDLIAQLFIISEHDMRSLEAWGYQSISGSCLVRSDTDLVDVTELRRGIQHLKSTTFSGYVCEWHPDSFRGLPAASRPNP